MIEVLSITSLTTPPFLKKRENYHVTNVIISPTGGVHYNTCHSKLTVKKLGFFCGSIATNVEHVLLIIEKKWLEVIVHMTKFEFLHLPCPK